jgi:N-acetylglucosaminyl-diphospho-decaprenol L-rhamnosyltransferase
VTPRLADVAVIIISYNTEHLLGECLQTLHDECGALKQQVIVVDNNSRDGSVSMIRSRFRDVELIESRENLGFARAVNLAATRANAEFLLLLNPDTVVLDYAVERLVQFARATPGHGIYGGRTVKRDGTLERSSCWALPTVWSMTCFALGLTTLFRNSPWFDPESMAGWNRDTVREVGIVTGCLLLAPRDAWLALNGLDERYFMYGEDADLAFRARNAGFRPIICPDAYIVHDVGKASATRADKLLLLFRGKATLLREHFPGWRRRFVLLALLAGVGLRAMLARIGPKSNLPQADGWSRVWCERRDWLQGYPVRDAVATPARPKLVETLQR